MAGKGLTATQQALIDGVRRTVKFAVEIDTSTPVRICTGAGPVLIDSDRYDPRGFEIGNIRVGPSGGQCTITIDDHEDLPGQSVTLAETMYSERLTDKAVIIYLLVLDDEAGAWSSAIELRVGKITAASGDGKSEITIEVDEHAGDRRRACLHVGSRNCTNTYEGGRCGYTAGILATCDGSWTECTARGRTVRFRGLRFALEPGTVIEIGPTTFTLQPPVFRRWVHLGPREDDPVTVVDAPDPTTLTEVPPGGGS
jgi:hypothetical protein